MKKITYIIFLFSIVSCSNNNNSEIKKQSKEEEKEAIQLKRAERELKYDKEKIALLSTIRGVHYDTLYSILKDYYYKLDRKDNNDTFVLNAILFSTEQHGFPKSKIASFIFSYKYEMLTKEEIEENAFSNQNDY